MKQTKKTIRAAIAELREAIDDDDQGILLQRIAYEVETALRWAIEDTTKWESPLDGVKGAVCLIVKDLDLPIIPA